MDDETRRHRRDGIDRRVLRPGPAQGRIRRRRSWVSVRRAPSRTPSPRAPSIAARRSPKRSPQADLVFLSQTIGRILDTIRHLDPLVRPGHAGHRRRQHQVRDRRPGAAEHHARCQFLGGHPMAGKEKRGAAAADGDLFRGRTWVLTPDEPEELETARAPEFRTWLERIGARRACARCRRARSRGVAHVAPGATGVHGAGGDRRRSARRAAAAASAAGPGWRT